MARMIIGLCGFARSGKDTTAQALTRLGWLRAAFADELKADLEKMIGRPFITLTPAEKEEWRPHMVEYAKIRRKQNPDYWVERLKLSLYHVRPDRPLVITDVRYTNEMAWIRDQGGLVIRLTRGKPANKEEAKSLAACEKIIHEWHTIDNRTGGIRAARKELINLVACHYGEHIHWREK